MMNIFYNHALTLHLLPCHQHQTRRIRRCCAKKEINRKFSAYLLDK